jgi:hypothetical protein
MGRKTIRETRNKMDLVAAVAAKWPAIKRNAILGFTMDSMREALLAGNPGALTAPDKGELTCVVKGCSKPQGRGLAVCVEHRRSYLASLKVQS